MSQKIRHVLVVGHTGFIGGSIHRQLQKAGVSVSGVSSKECNLLDPDATKACLGRLPAESSVVFCSVVNRRKAHDISSFHDNVAMVDNFVKAARDADLRSVCYLSTVDIYGFSPILPITEFTIPHPVTYYALSKYCCERLIAGEQGLPCPVTILRLPGIYGPGGEEWSIIGSFASRIARGQPIPLHGDGKVLRDYVHVHDVGRVVAHFLTAPTPVIFNVATGISRPLRAVVELLAQALGTKAVTETLPANPAAAQDLVFNSARLQAELQFPLMALEEGINQYVDYLKQKAG